MQLFEVLNRSQARDFIRVQVVLNKNNPNYIRPLDKDIHEVFDKKKNKAFRNGEATRWILKNEAGECVGRIAAFVNKKYKSTGDELPVGGIGFFDCINNQNAADILFDVAKHWLMQRGMEAMDGPINFGERDRWWGLLVKGFQPPLYAMNYNLPYYRLLFEDYGFQNFYNQYCYGYDHKKEFSAKTVADHEAVAKDGNFSAGFIKGNNLEKYAIDFASVYNKAWAGHGSLKEMNPEQAIRLFRKMKPVMDKRIVWFVYYRHEPIAVFLNLPDVNHWFKWLNGQFDLWHKLKFLWIKRTSPCKRLAGLAFGVVPEFQGKGVDSYLMVEARRYTATLSYEEYEGQWIGDFNTRMISIAENIGDSYHTRVLATYRYLFDRTKEFKRHPMIG
jgi:GNAT superfamily N-acetyltransferase